MGRSSRIGYRTGHPTAAPASDPASLEAVDQRARRQFGRRIVEGVADAQVWTVIALLAAAVFAIVIEMRRMHDRMTDGFIDVSRQLGELRGEFGELRGEFGGLRGEFGALASDVRAQIADVRSELGLLRADLQGHVERDHPPS